MTNSNFQRSSMLLTTQSRAFGCPQRYIQGPGEFENIFVYGREYGDRFLFIVDAGIEKMMRSLIENITDKADCSYEITLFASESCMEEVERLSAIAKGSGCSVIVGAGGGKVLDTAKLTADEADMPRIIVPTSASNDAPAADWAAIYTPEGVHITGRKTRRSTELVLVDSKIIVNAPARLFAAGIGDALATWYEASAGERASTPNCVAKGYRRSRAGMAVCRECLDILLEDGVMAMKAVKNHCLSEAVENVIEANVLLSGLGFINGGLAAAHGLHSGFSEIKGSERYLHGEKVAFALLCELVLENAPREEIYEIMDFMAKVELPITLAQIGIEPTDENMDIILDHTMNKNALIHHEPLAISKDNLKSAILLADALGREYLSAL